MQSPTSAPASSAEIIRLNVGGRRFHTTRQTLLASPASHSPNFFHGLLSGRVGTALDDTGAYFIDRDPEHFPHVLNYLRTGSWRGGTRDALDEAAFYGVEVKTTGAIVTDANLLSAAQDSYLAAVAKHHDDIVKIMEAVSPVLLECVQECAESHPCVRIYILPARVNPEDLRIKAQQYVLSTWNYRVTVSQQAIIEAYRALFAIRGAKAAVALDGASKLLTSLKKEALELYIREHFQLNLSFSTGWGLTSVHNPGKSDELKLVLPQGRENQPILTCCELSWSRSDAEVTSSCSGYAKKYS